MALGKEGREEGKALCGWVLREQRHAETAGCEVALFHDFGVWGAGSFCFPCCFRMIHGAWHIIGASCVCTVSMFRFGSADCASGMGQALF